MIIEQLGRDMWNHASPTSFCLGVIKLIFGKEFGILKYKSERMSILEIRYSRHEKLTDTEDKEIALLGQSES
jgi:hypothetical protein